MPTTRVYLNWMLRHSRDLQIATLEFTSKLSVYTPGHKMLTFVTNTEIISKSLCSSKPVHGITIFTDASGKTGKATYVWREKGQWKQEVLHETNSHSTQSYWQ